MHRRAFLGTVAVGFLIAPLEAGAQPAGKSPRIGILRPGSPPDPLLDAFRQGLRELGYEEGRNLSIEYRWAEGRDERLPELAADLVRLKVDVIVAGAGAVEAAKHATTTIPIVMPLSSDPVRAGLVASLARPGGKVTGLAGPTASNPRRPRRAGRTREPSWRWGHRSFYVHRTRLVELAAKHRLPTVYPQREFVEGAGGLMSYGANYHHQFRRAATLVDKILKGAKPADLPVEQPTKFELVINLKAAKALGLTIPPAVLARADEVIHQ